MSCAWVGVARATVPIFLFFGEFLRERPSKKKKRTIFLSKLRAALFHGNNGTTETCRSVVVLVLLASLSCCAENGIGIPFDHLGNEFMSIVQRRIRRKRRLPGICRLDRFLHRVFSLDRRVPRKAKKSQSTSLWVRVVVVVVALLSCRLPFFANDARQDRVISLDRRIPRKTKKSQPTSRWVRVVVVVALLSCCLVVYLSSIDFFIESCHLFRPTGSPRKAKKSQPTS